MLTVDEQRKRLDEIRDEIKKKMDELENVKGTECEIYTRIVGYYRPVDKWNTGKRDEYNQRVEFEVMAGD